MIYLLILKRIKTVYRAKYEAPTIEQATAEVNDLLTTIQWLVPKIESVELVSVELYKEKVVAESQYPFFLDVFFDTISGQQVLIVGSNFLDALYFDQFDGGSFLAGAIAGVADFGKYTVFVADKIYFNGNIWATLLFQVTALKVQNEAACNVEWATQTLQIATDLDWVCKSDFVPNEKDGVYQMPPLMKWEALLPNEPRACVISLTVCHWSVPFEKMEEYRINSEDKMYNYILSVSPAHVAN